MGTSFSSYMVVLIHDSEFQIVLTPYEIPHEGSHTKNFLVAT
jgi:hypothetical protein